MNMVVCIEEIFSFCQTVLRKMGLSEIKLHHPSQGMTYQDFQRMYGVEFRTKVFENEIISYCRCIGCIWSGIGQGYFC